MSSLSIDATQLTLGAFSLGASQSIGGITGTSSTQVGTPAINSNGDSDGGVGPASSTAISKPAQLFRKLQQLQQQDPTKFKQVVTDIANKLTSAAQNATGTDQKFLSNLASKFQQAENGDLSSLQPSQPPTSSNSAIAAYTQNDQSKTLSLLSPGQQSGGHHGPSSDVKKTLDSIFSEVTSALNGASTSTTSDTAIA